MAIEIDRFGDYLKSTCRPTPATRDRRVQHVGAFLSREFSTEAPCVSQLSATDLDGFFAALSSRLRPASLRIVCNILRSYFRYRSLCGDATAGLAVVLPRIADWRRAAVR